MRKFLVAAIVLIAVATPQLVGATPVAPLASKLQLSVPPSVQKAYWVVVGPRRYWRPYVRPWVRPYYRPYVVRPYYRPYYRPYVRRCFRRWPGGPLRCW